MRDVKNRANAAQHGTRSMYCGGCRCEPCRVAAREYAAHWRWLSRANGWVFINGYRVRFNDPACGNGSATAAETVVQEARRG